MAYVLLVITIFAGVPGVSVASHRVRVFAPWLSTYFVYNTLGLLCEWGVLLDGSPGTFCALLGELMRVCAQVILPITFIPLTSLSVEPSTGLLMLIGCKWCLLVRGRLIQVQLV